MRISLLCSDIHHPIYPCLESWKEINCNKHDINIVQHGSQLEGGDILFLISCSEVIDNIIRSKFAASLVIHASDLPNGKGWSPHIWQILEGKNEITVTLLEAEDKVDSGRIWSHIKICLSGHELADEINTLLFRAEIELMDFATREFLNIKPYPQNDSGSTYYRKRTPDDSRLDPNKSLAEQFNLIRVADSTRFPNFFELHGFRYELIVKKAGR
ncbi:UDP-glucuronic acid dehydrogenase [Herbaspirillum autotrophicum]|uniref:UDP-glucuronic acid dehydrogenase n=1 Tax=Herbaspirillum autotrophicum TaxID=180195 RepID=UPI00067E0A23|nr:UDP-glucuronic acid dehydrogenase [Herbaspirillum autotrophicum]